MNGFTTVRAIAMVSGALLAQSVLGVGIQGTMSNFDVFNETGSNVYGAEIELEGLHPTEVTKTFPCHFTGYSATEAAVGTTYVTRITFTGYTFNPPNAYIIPRTGQTTNGHYAVNMPGCEHFGFAVSRQPTKTSFFWLNQSGQRMTSALSIPMPTWTYVPGAGGGAPMVQAVLAPVPPPPLVQFPDAVWVKTYVKEMASPADLNELISYDPVNPDPAHPSVAPELPGELEAEWELLPGDSPLQEPDIQVGNGQEAVVRRFEFYKYTGLYDEVHLPTSTFSGGTPLPSELGQFIAANMVAANLAIPGACCVTATGACSITSEANCGAGSTWVAAGSCVPNACPQPQVVGACCNGSVCTLATQAACGAGAFKGPGSACNPGGAGNPTTCCPANFDQTGGVQVADIFAFLNAWFAGDPATDFDGSGVIAVADIFAFLNAWFVGCG